MNCKRKELTNKKSRSTKNYCFPSNLTIKKSSLISFGKPTFLCIASQYVKMLLVGPVKATTSPLARYFFFPLPILTPFTNVPLQEWSSIVVWWTLVKSSSLLTQQWIWMILPICTVKTITKTNDVEFGWIIRPGSGKQRDFPPPVLWMTILFSQSVQKHTTVFFIP